MVALLRHNLEGIFSRKSIRGLLTRGGAIENAARENHQEDTISAYDRTLSFPPLGVPLCGVKQPIWLPDFIEPAKTVITTLSNGLRIGTQYSSDPCVSVGLLVDSGCIYEDKRRYGASHLLEKMAFHSTKNRLKAILAQEAQAAAMNLTCSSARDQIFYVGNGIKTFLPQIVEILIDSVRNAAFEDREVSEKILEIKEELECLNNNPQSIIINKLHAVGYIGDYAKYSFASKASLQRLNGLVLRQFVDETFSGCRMVLSAVGVEHSEFLAIVGPLLSDLPSENKSSVPKFKYVGGDWRNASDLPDSHIALAFEVRNGWQNERLSNHLTVLMFLLGGGDSFSVGGPGKGMYSRFYRNALRYQEIKSIQSFSSIYNHTGLFGVYFRVNSEFASQAVDIVCKELLSLTARGKVTYQELERAKRATISAVLMSLECKAAVVEDIACQIMSYGRRRPIDDFVAEIRRMTLNDVRIAAREVLSTPLTMTSLGPDENIPTYQSIYRHFSNL
ncbi:hypothetical protein KP509_02G060900 [Ceratopteris richardii]|uniref:Alpha-MPP n=1 Tax=Ceratopteris richardii TaxID=49495 RepID=A0A8T2V9G3_CERRI|nr:hypothetical protein KP509_02G060900 [Ceratopteris richardii]KAH7444022.1 hypothetical protein KP509_02G060900 [Ceratopteris richardii]